MLELDKNLYVAIPCTDHRFVQWYHYKIYHDKHIRALDYIIDRRDDRAEIGIVQEIVADNYICCLFRTDTGLWMREDMIPILSVYRLQPVYSVN